MKKKLGVFMFFSFLSIYSYASNADKGNGIYNYSVATDYYYGNQSPSLQPSLKTDLNQYKTTNISYVFPVFGYLDADRNGALPDPSSFSLTCSPGQVVVFNYYANPLMKSTAVPGVDKALGGCVDGMDVTAYYNTFIKHTVPTVEYSSSFINAISAPNLEPVLIKIADNIASVINNDPNAYGVAFDNEPSINSVSKVYGFAYEKAFFGEIALQLSKQNKFLFLFDANATGIDLFKNGYTGSAVKNIILLQPLYDLEDTSAYEMGPVSLTTYTKDAQQQIQSYLADANSPPVMFMIPASATDTIWNSLQGYDMAATVPPKPIQPYINPTSLSNPSTCDSSDASKAGTIANTVLSSLLTDSQGSQVNPATNINNFLGKDNCVKYTNSQSLINYFDAVLTAIKTSTASTNNRYLGNTLYAWRIKSQNDISAGSHYYNVYGDSSLYKINTQVFPSNIEDKIWTSFNK